SGLTVPDQDADSLHRFWTFGESVFTGDAKTLVLDTRRDVYFFDAATGNETDKIPHDGGPARWIVPSPNKKLVLGANYGGGPKSGAMSMLDISTRETSVSALGDWLSNAVAFSPDGRTFAIAMYRPEGDWRGEIRLYETA